MSKIGYRLSTNNWTGYKVEKDFSTGQYLVGNYEFQAHNKVYIIYNLI